MEFILFFPTRPAKKPSRIKTALLQTPRANSQTNVRKKAAFSLRSVLLYRYLLLHLKGKIEIKRKLVSLMILFFNITLWKFIEILSIS